MPSEAEIAKAVEQRCYEMCRAETARNYTGWCHALCQLAGMWCPHECPDAVATYGDRVAALLRTETPDV